MKTIREIFSEKFKGTPSIFIAPGRINLIGEHTDYNEGFVMPAAINYHITFAIAPNGTDRYNFHALDYNETTSFDLSGMKAGDGWINYLMGVGRWIFRSQCKRSRLCVWKYDTRWGRTVFLCRVVLWLWICHQRIIRSETKQAATCKDRAVFRKSVRRRSVWYHGSIRISTWEE
ncbi:MAG: galactokinase family protein [Bacteroidota bacterium]